MKERLDVLLVKRGLAESREKAKGAIMAGTVFVDGRRIDKPGTGVGTDAEIEIKGESLPFVSRGGLKLAKALAVFPVKVEGKIAVDIGASTGGFTDCLLQNGAAKVYAVDVGYGQLAWSLRQDSRVVVMERTNIRYVTRDQLAEPADLAVIDVSFISLTKVLQAASDLLIPQGEIIALIKPQFEAGRELVGKKGVVRDARVQADVIAKVLDFAQSIGLGILGMTYSPITGPEGNIEFLAYWQKGQDGVDRDFDNWSRQVVEAARADLG
ncbi:MAG: TlyA family RNA methyltransferase [Firmicutes bacterium]|jgi:23S rRNA (cytidine1920-2'-O)/16S rRNA (cytidine1409-2'-O)-methyltransferase|nr:TlyA family RNA methyltransferase [Bacillota bacterium]